MIASIAKFPVLCAALGLPAFSEWLSLKEGYGVRLLSALLSCLLAAASFRVCVMLKANEPACP